ncbi:MAG TPA: hypothetical protein VLR26_11280, partial [Frankiaceae bacterium]|nr:hypothetical protein [Frankiaceae bacterium]
MFDRSSVPVFDVHLALGPPCRESVLMLLSIDPETLSPADSVAAGIGAERAGRLLDGRQLRFLSQAAGGHRLDGDLNEVGQELAAATNLYPVTASVRTDLGCSATRRLPTALTLLEAGVLTQRHVEKLEQATRELTDEQARAVDADAVPPGPKGLASRTATAIARIAPEQAKKKTEQIRRGRTVLPWSDPAEGVAGIALQGPLDQVAQIKAAIDTDARLRLAGDPRLLETRRFDVLYDWARDRLGLPPAQHPDRPTPPPAAPAGEAAGPAGSAERGRCGSCGRSGPNTIPINVTVSLETLLGLSELPGDLDGAPIPASVARELAADGRWRRWIVEASTGRLLD